MSLHTLRCAWCHGSLFVGRACPRCNTRLHEDCWGLAGACPTLGCATDRRTRHTTLGPPELYRRPSCLMWAIGLAVGLACVAGGLVLWRAAAPERERQGRFVDGLVEVLAIEGHAGHGLQVRFTPDGARLIATFDAGVGLYSVADGRQLAFASELKHERDLLAVSPRGDLAVVGRAVVRLADLSPVARLPLRLWSGAVAFSPDGAVLAAVVQDETVAPVTSQLRLRGATLKLLDPGTGITVGATRLPGVSIGWPRSAHLVFSSDGGAIAVARARHLHLVTRDEVVELGALAGEPRDLLGLTWDGQGLRAADETRLLGWTPFRGIAPSIISLTAPHAERGGLMCAATHPDGQRWALGWLSGVCLAGGDRPRWGEHHGVYGVAFSPDGSLLATAGHDNHLRVWRVPPK